ncbi:MAG TPA: hypothetical protein PLI23_09765 [Thermoclostridium caenicola]|uniref:hypothetical protein n=1 Tax=Thermoclostridium caenicola TaxID=659425 RepID=UPI002CB71D25|nr:hypothetical protein [Thermoclostridium caenicola]HPO77439.1 hypothetical protein [Thermoclostridium caenicola]
MPEVVATEELKLDLIRVVCDPNPLFKYQLIYRDGNATGMVGVYSYDEDWYYLYKEDNDRYKVKRRKDLEGIEPAFTYKQRKRRIDQPDNQKTLNSKKAKVAEIGDENMAIEVVTENTAAKALDMNRNQALTQDDPSSELPEQTSGMQMGGM